MIYHFLNVEFYFSDTFSIIVQSKSSIIMYANAHVYSRYIHTTHIPFYFSIMILFYSSLNSHLLWKINDDRNHAQHWIIYIEWKQTSEWEKKIENGLCVSFNFTFSIMMCMRLHLRWQNKVGYFVVIVWLISIEFYALTLRVCLSDFFYFI